MNNVSPPKRFACDRCREQKLRCPRNEQVDGFCERCIRAGTLCVTSNGHPSGRRPYSGPNGTQRQPPNNNQPSHQRKGTKSTRQRQVQPNQSHISSSITTPPSISNPDLTTLLSLDTSFNNIFNPPISDAEFPPNTAFDSGTSSPLTPGDSLWMRNMQQLNFGILSESMEVEADTTLDYGHGANATNVISGQSLLANEQSNDSSMLWCVRLIGALSRQLAELRAKPWDSSFLRISWLDGVDTDGYCPVQPNILEKTLSVSWRFILILQSMAPTEHSTPSSITSPISISMILMVLSLYLQLVQLFETIFIHMRHSLQRMPDEESAAFSQRQAGGLPSPPWRVHVITTIRVLEHQLYTLERLMGFPNDFRLWSQEDSFPGILGHQDSSKLLQAVLGQPYDESLGISQIRSLKQNIDHVQEFLRD